MKRLFIIFFVLIAFVVTGCKFDSDVLATYNGGKITRGDFYEWVESNGYNKKALKDTGRQKENLRKMFIEKILIEKARQDGFDQSEGFQALLAYNAEGLLRGRLYDSEIKEKAKFKEPAVKLRQIFLRVKEFKIDEKQKNKRIILTDKEKEAEFQKVLIKARNIIQKLNKGEGFEVIAMQESEDYTKSKGGDMGFVVRDMLPPELAQAVFSLKEDEITQEPVRTAKGVYIAKVEDKEEITEENADNVMSNKAHAMRIKSGMMRRDIQKFIDDLMSAPDVVIYEDKVKSKKSDTVIFKVGKKNYTIGDLQKRIELRESGSMNSRNKDMKKRGIPDDRKLVMAKDFYREEILSRAAIFKGLNKDPEYLKKLKSQEEKLIYREYYEKLTNEQINIKEEDILKEYNENKNKRYTKMVQQGKYRIKKVVPYKDIKDEIKRRLESKFKSEFSNKWQQELLIKHNFKMRDDSEVL